VTEEQWLACTDPWALVRQVIALGGTVTERKRRLLSAALAEHTGLGRVKLRAALARYAEGQSNGALMDQARRLHEDIFPLLFSGIGVLRGPPRLKQWHERLPGVRQVASSLLRDLLSNPYRPVAADPAWLSWNGGAVVQLAEAAYEERALPSGELDPARLAVLADALEEAGCADPVILAHLRGPGPHVRGCWAVDLLLGKK
jgi:hypothetical protein